MGKGVAILNRAVIGGHSDHVLFEQRPEGSEGVNCEDMWWKRISGRASNK